jgi:hypothetical protein
MKALLACLMTLLAACSAMPESVSEDRARFEALAAQINETALMRELACRAQARSEGKNEAEAKCPDRSDDVLSALDVNRSTSAMQVVARLPALSLDAAPSEGRGCIIVRRGKAILPLLKQLDPGLARADCAALLERSRGSSREFPDVKPENVCNTETDIAGIRDEYIHSIETGEQCWPWLFD